MVRVCGEDGLDARGGRGVPYSKEPTTQKTGDLTKQAPAITRPDKVIDGAPDLVGPGR